MIEHLRKRETRKRSTHRQGVELIYTQFRFVCGCGYATPWCGRERHAERYADIHALHGQLSHT